MISSASPQNVSFIQKLFSNGTIRSKLVADILQTIDRADFCQFSPYVDSPQSIGFSVTISAPHMHVHALELLKDHLANAQKSLDVGSGSGYLTLAFAKLMKQQNSVSYGIEHIPHLVEQSIQNISKNHKDFLQSGKVQIYEGDGRVGLKKSEKYDVIHVGAAVEKTPQALLEQLSNGGRLIAPVGNRNHQDFMIYDKDQQGVVTSQSAFGVIYVPLTSKEKQCPDLFQS